MPGFCRICRTFVVMPRKRLWLNQLQGQAMKQAIQARATLQATTPSENVSLTPHPLRIFEFGRLEKKIISKKPIHLPWSWSWLAETQTRFQELHQDPGVKIEKIAEICSTKKAGGNRCFHLFTSYFRIPGHLWCFHKRLQVKTLGDLLEDVWTHRCSLFFCRKNEGCPSKKGTSSSQVLLSTVVSCFGKWDFHMGSISESIMKGLIFSPHPHPSQPFRWSQNDNF